MLGRATSTARRRWPLLFIGVLTLVSVLFAGLWLGAAHATPKNAAVFDNFNDKLTQFSAVDSNGASCASPVGVWLDVPSSTMTFNLSGTAARHILVDVSVVSALGAGGEGEVRLVVDGVVQGIGPMVLSNRGTTNGNTITGSYLNLTGALAPGSHTAKLQFMADALTFCIDQFTYAALHA
jgi:hypothetical protein